ncbi:hypothetical protein UY3_03682 [Chelonia mydas]|uniref:Uncharacterized protein n=1 Tax=Chelonia mydas TaxID=8469 RepID=M7C3U5_CHEMY|nr:hypothetical protein UY3_03682 [Chelonia mydas]
MDSFPTLVRTPHFVLALRAFDDPRRKPYISDSSEEEEGAAEGSPLPQPMMDTPEPNPKTQLLMRKTDQYDSLSLSTPMEEGDHGSWESPMDEVNRKYVTQLNDAFLEDPEALDSIASDNKDELGPFCFCSTLVQTVDNDAKDDGYMDLRGGLAWNLLSQCHVVSIKKSCILLDALLFMLSLITALGKSFLKIVKAMS